MSNPRTYGNNSNTINRNNRIGGVVKPLSPSYTRTLENDCITCRGKSNTLQCKSCYRNTKQTKRK